MLNESGNDIRMTLTDGYFRNGISDLFITGKRGIPYETAET